MSTHYTVSLMLLLLLVVAVSVTLPLDDSQMRDSLAFSEISTFETAPFEDVLAGAGSEAIDDRRHYYYRLPLKKPSHSDDKDDSTIVYPLESLAAVDKQSQTIVVFYHGEEANLNTKQTPSCPTIPSC